MGEETVDGLESKYVTGLSTIMVATIQEAKDRISQIEYIFCSQLYPNFQSKSKTFEKIYSEARLAACNVWKEREKNLLSEIEELKSQNLALIKEKEKLSEELDKDLKLENERVKSENLALIKDKEKLSQEVDKELKLENERVKSENLTLIKDKEKLSEELDKLVTMPFRLKSLEDYIVCFKLKSKKRSDEMQNCIQLHTGLVEVLSVKGSDELNKDEKQRLTTRLQVFEENVGRLQELLRQKADELKEGKMSLEVLQGKLDSTKMEMLVCKKQIVDHEKENLVVMGNAKALEEEHRSYLAELEALRLQSEEKSSELAMEIKRRKDAHSAYKKLKTHYNYLCKRFGLTADSVPHQSHLEDDTNQSGQHERPAISSSVEKKHTETVRNGTGSSGSCEKESIIKTVQTPTTSISPILRSPGVRSDPSSAKSPQLSGLKRPASIWRDTRSRQSPGGRDPHDDFLDTPVENMKRVAGEEKQVHDASKKDDSDEETQDLNPKPSPSRQRIQVAETSKKSFKHVEPVRKKAERENLKGIECKQCKKFYDAVLPENEGNGRSLRCEHHEGVSRNRYKYAPPMTPEGFWNIGFESEM